ncbi:MAG: ABC transporter ATP-binding protein [Candidatus Competibacteraceae bacterium]|nr:ABC transporter ATP-binding protein [Candidatus Competibacteraceae bacterium]
MTASFIAIRNLSKHYAEGDQRRTIFADLSLDINRGECVSLLGPSGSGKSTLLNLLAGIDLPDAGTIQVEGRIIGELTEKERTLFRRRHIGFVFQFFNLIPTLTVEENLLLPLELNGQLGMEPRQDAFNLLESIGLGNRRHSFPEQLSGGEQQRLAIARAVVHRPLLLLADEPTGNLDAATGERILELLLDLHRRSGATVILVTHSRDIAARAGRTLYLDSGQIREIRP